MSFLKTNVIDLASELRKLAKAILKDDDLVDEYERKIDQAVLTLISGSNGQESVNADEQVNTGNQVNDKQVNDLIRSIQKILLERNDIELALECTSLCYDLKDMGVDKIVEIFRFLLALIKDWNDERTAILDTEKEEMTAECFDSTEMELVGQLENALNSKAGVESSENVALTGEKEKDKKISTNSVVVPRNAYDPEKVIREIDSLMHDCLYVLQGFSGNFIRIDRTAETVQFIIPVKKAFGQQVKELSIYGFCYLKLRRFCDKFSNSNEKKVFLTAFSVTVDNLLRRYYAAIAELETKLLSRIRKNQENQKHRGKHIGLLPEEVFVKLWDFKAPMLSMCRIVDKAEEWTSGKFMSKVYGEVFCGHSKIEKLAKDALGKVCLKLKQMILSWMYEGVIENGRDEFFIYKTKTNDSNDSWWNDSYQIRESCVPCFLSPHIVRKILITGKSVLFLQKACGQSVDISFVHDQRDLLQEVAPTCMFMIEKHEKINSLITESYKAVSRAVLDVLPSKLNIKFHLKALKDYVLLYRGDFATHLWEVLREELNEPNSMLRMQSLTFALECAVLGSSSKADFDNLILNQIDLKFLQPIESDNSLDNLIITYRMTPQVSAMYNETTKPIYDLLFSFLWRLRRLSFMLYSNGGNLVSSSTQLKIVPEFSNLWQEFALMNRELSNFIKNVEHYFYSQVIENEWLKFMSAMEDAVDFENVISAHSEFLKQLLDKMFLSEKHAKVTVHLRTLFGMVLDFQKLYGQFIAAVDEEEDLEDMKRMMNADCEELRYVEEFQEDGNESAKEEKLPANVKARFFTSLTLFKDAYRIAMGQLLVALVEEDDRMLRQFSLEIDFNRWFYYENEQVRNSIRFRSIKQ
ncbi:Gamma-tubulin complex component 3 [Trichinella nelsoni]|uniref:Gamma-tubulin complex component 3 n=1 Tax=Trichinella nelsoni TaxID=6336 RepID=A0A0V0RK32_9BILA|nr:Gamma-tubulin complex component 3 [Trichinella nelsoni]